MSKFNFACRFMTVEDGTEIIKCRDLPELLSWPAEGETLEQWAHYAVKDCVAFRLKDGLEVPEATPAEDGEYVVEISLTEEAKIILHNEMVRAKVSRSALAEKNNLTLPEVTRLLNYNHRTKIETIDSALRSLGKKLSFSVEDV